MTEDAGRREFVDIWKRLQSRPRRRVRVNGVLPALALCAWHGRRPSAQLRLGIRRAAVAAAFWAAIFAVWGLAHVLQGGQSLALHPFVLTPGLVAMGLVGGVVALSAFTVVGSVVDGPEPRGQPRGRLGVALAAVHAALLAPLWEEVAFRLPLLISWVPLWVTLPFALGVFALGHGSRQRTATRRWSHVLAALAFAVVASGLTLYSRSLVPALVAHMLANGCIVVAWLTGSGKDEWAAARALRTLDAPMEVQAGAAAQP